MPIVVFTSEQLYKRLAETDAVATRVRDAIGGRLTMEADDWSKARAYEDLVLLAIQIGLQPTGTIGVEISREVAITFISAAKEAIANPITAESKALVS